MNRKIETTLRWCPTLPTLSGVALRIISLARDPNVELNQIAGVLVNDPALAAKTLRIANSSLYGRSRQARNLRQAVAVLGLNATVTLTLGFSLATCLRDLSDARLDLDQYWRRALLSALAARLLGSVTGMRSLEELFLGGLLQDIGMLALDVALPTEYAGLVAGITDHDALAIREREALDVDHREAGAWLMREWGLPEYLSMAALSSHDLSHRGMPVDLAPFAGCIAVSGRIADIYLLQDTDAATAKAVEAADSCLRLSAQTVSDVLTQMTELLPEIEALFERPVLSTTQAIGVTDHARELLATRNLQLLHAAVEARTREAELQSLADRLHEVARRDELTGVFNRRHFNAVLADEFDQARAHEWPLSLAYLDLDHFKSVNDRHGHHVGDKILMTMASHIQSQLRRDDLLARYGGEEFVLLMPGIDHTAAVTVVERIRAAAEAFAHELDNGQTLQVTLSAGVASYTGGQNAMQKPADLLRAADDALYSAKRQGRNRILVAE